MRGLNRQIAKLEGFKRNLLTSLQASEEVKESYTACLASLLLPGRFQTTPIVELQHQQQECRHVLLACQTAADSTCQALILPVLGPMSMLYGLWACLWLCHAMIAEVMVSGKRRWQRSLLWRGLPLPTWQERHWCRKRCSRSSCTPAPSVPHPPTGDLPHPWCYQLQILTLIGPGLGAQFFLVNLAALCLRGSDRAPLHVENVWVCGIATKKTCHQHCTGLVAEQAAAVATALTWLFSAATGRVNAIEQSTSRGSSIDLRNRQQ